MKSKCSFKGTGVWIVWFSQVCLFTGYWYWVLSELFVFHECVLSLGTGVSSTPPTGICHQTNEAGGGTRLDTRTPNPEHWDTNVQWGNILKKNLWGKLYPTEKTDFLDFWTLNWTQQSPRASLLNHRWLFWKLGLESSAPGSHCTRWPCWWVSSMCGWFREDILPPVLCREGPHPLLWAHARYGSALLLQTLWTLDKDTWSPDIYLTSQCDVDTL